MLSKHWTTWEFQRSGVHPPWKGAGSSCPSLLWGSPHSKGTFSTTTECLSL